MKVILVINNYLHDLATGFFFASTLIAYLLFKKCYHYNCEFCEEALELLRKIALYAFIGIFPFGLIRLTFFYKIELKPYAGVNMTEALVFKHLILFLLTFAGVYLWVKISKEKR